MSLKVAEISRNFERQFRKLPKKIQTLWCEKLDFLLEDIRHPSLRVKKMKGARNIWEMSITMNFRATFEIENEMIFLRKIGDHSILQNP